MNSFELHNNLPWKVYYCLNFADNDCSSESLAIYPRSTDMVRQNLELDWCYSSYYLMQSFTTLPILLDVLLNVPLGYLSTTGIVGRYKSRLLRLPSLWKSEKMRNSTMPSFLRFPVPTICSVFMLLIKHFSYFQKWLLRLRNWDWLSRQARVGCENSQKVPRKGNAIQALQLPQGQSEETHTHW